MTATVEYGIHHHGRVIVGPDWACEADVVYGFHGFGEARAVGVLVRRTPPDGAWAEARPLELVQAIGRASPRARGVDPVSWPARVVDAAGRRARPAAGGGPVRITLRLPERPGERLSSEALAGMAGQPTRVLTQDDGVDDVLWEARILAALRVSDVDAEGVLVQVELLEEAIV